MLREKGLLGMSGAEVSATGAEAASDMSQCHASERESHLPEVWPFAARTS